MALPSGLIQLNYIQSTGSQYIELPYMANSGLSVTMTVDPLNGEGALFGARSSSYAIGVYQTAMSGTSATSGYIQYGSQRKNFTNFPSSMRGMQSCRVFVSNSQMTVNNLYTTGGSTGGRVNYNISPSSFETNLPLYLFAENYNGTARKNYRACIFSVIINNYYLTPCMQASTGKPGLYDTYKRAFYTSSSGTDFTPGGLVGLKSPPNTYTKIDYIETTGTQYIDTRYIPNSNTRVVIDFEPTGATFGSLFGARTATESSVFGMWINSTSAFPHYGNGAYNQKPITIPAETRLTFNMNRATTTVNETSVTFDSTTFNSGCNLTLFGMNTAGTVDSRRAVGKLYSCKIYNGGTLIRDFVPCINPSGVAGLWDKVTGTFYASANGTFTTGRKHKTLIDGTGYEIKSGRVLIAGTGYDIKKGRTLIDGTGYDISFGTPVGELEEGTLIKINESGLPVDFYVAKHNYESGLNGSGRTLVVRKDCHSKRPYSDRTGCEFPDSVLYTWLNNTYITYLDEFIRSAIGTTKFKYTAGSNVHQGKIATGECAIFLLGAAEVDPTNNPDAGYADGTLLPIADALKIAYFEGSPVKQWTRAWVINNGTAIVCMSTTGGSIIFTVLGNASATNGVRPIFTLPADMCVDSDFNVIPS